MGTNRTAGTTRRLFTAVAISTGVLLGLTGRIYGEDIALWLRETALTESGLLLTGWLISGPPVLLTLLVWNERGRFATSRRRELAVLLGLWCGLNLIIAPAWFGGVTEQFGEGALVGRPLTLGWEWGATANVISLLFAGAVLGVQRDTVSGPANSAQREITARFLERAAVLVLAATLGFALYGNGAGIFTSTT